MKSVNDRIDELELAMQDLPPVDCPVTHEFTKDFYIRTVEMPENALISSRQHLTEHCYQVMEGIAHVKINDGEWETIEAPYSGVTFPGTRRVLFIEKKCRWATFHKLEKGERPTLLLEEEVTESVEKIEARIIEPHVNKLLGGVVRNNIITNQTEKVCHG